MNVTAEVDPRDVAALNRVVNRMAREMPRDTADVVTEAARVTVRKAYQATPTARKTTMWAWENKDELKRMRLVTPVATRGARYAKACWIPALQKLGAKTNDQPAKEGNYIDKRRGLAPSFEAENACPYIEQLDSGGTLYPIPSNPKPHPAKPKNIMAKAILRGTAALDKRMDKFANSQQSKWGR